MLFPEHASTARVSLFGDRSLDEWDTAMPVREITSALKRRAAAFCACVGLLTAAAPAAGQGVVLAPFGGQNYDSP
jgi:hypothetical protein